VALAAESLGFTLRTMNFDQWIQVKDNGIWNEYDLEDSSLPKHVLASLKLSYSYMSPYLKPCFTYCANFPKGQDILKRDLIYHWISSDFIKPTKLLSSIQIGEKYIVQLLGLSFFQQEHTKVCHFSIPVQHLKFSYFSLNKLKTNILKLLIKHDNKNINSRLDWNDHSTLTN
jgi:hypothetical protein